MFKSESLFPQPHLLLIFVIFLSLIKSVSQSRYNGDRSIAGSIGILVLGVFQFIMPSYSVDFRIMNLSLLFIFILEQTNGKVLFFLSNDQYKFISCECMTSFWGCSLSYTFYVFSVCFLSVQGHNFVSACAQSLFLTSK